MMSIPVLTIDSYPGKTVASVLGVTTAVEGSNAYDVSLSLQVAIDKLVATAKTRGADAVLGCTFATGANSGYYYVIASGTLVKFASDHAMPF